MLHFFGKFQADIPHNVAHGFEIHYLNIFINCSKKTGETYNELYPFPNSISVFYLQCMWLRDFSKDGQNNLVMDQNQQDECLVLQMVGHQQ